MWSGTVFNNLGNGRTVATLKAWSIFSMRYTAVPNVSTSGDGSSGSSDGIRLTGNVNSRKITLPLDVEDTVTCFCRFV